MLSLLMLCIINLELQIATSKTVLRHPYDNLSITDNIKKYGYPVEQYDIVTEDKYILTTYRIPHGPKTNTTNKNAILLSHGLLGTCENFLVQGPKRAVSYFLAENGYDVWLMNARGTLHSKGHQIYNYKTDKQYWNFSFHEIGKYDLPANIDFILKKINETQMFFLGHSQGGTIYYVMTSERPEYNQKIKMNIQFAPSVAFKFVKAPLFKIISGLTLFIEQLLSKLNIHNLVPQQEALLDALREICGDTVALKEICTYVLYSIGGTDSGLLNQSSITWIVSNSPGGLSARQAVHYLQVVAKGIFRQFDYGVKGNLIAYNSTTPPLYKFEQATSPTALFHSRDDWLAPSEGVMDLANKLPNVVLNHQVRYKGFNHIDFVFAYNAFELVYIHAYRILQKFS